ncbi:MAG TPA: sulfurtransferase [Dehalococcoidia bacterium]|nr:sulfurtransferase [Dehalococcoidia bacterium]
MSYPNPDILAETNWLAEHISEPELLVVDCDEFPAYMRLHIAGAIGLRTHHYLKEEGDSASGPGIGTHIMDPDRFAQTMSRHGIGNDTQVVAYDNMGGLYASRLWWALDYFGHSKCKVLNGGFRKWFEEGRAVSMEMQRIAKANFEVSGVRDEICASLDDVKAAIDSRDTVVWDVRSKAEHEGEETRANKRGGHIPGAKHIEWLELQQPPIRSGLMLPADEIQARLDAIGVTKDKRVITHCQAGIRAAQGVFVLRLMGYPDVRNYDASWAEWGNRDDTPIEK